MPEIPVAKFVAQDCVCSVRGGAVEEEPSVQTVETRQTRQRPQWQLHSLTRFSRSRRSASLVGSSERN